MAEAAHEAGYQSEMPSDGAFEEDVVASAPTRITSSRYCAGLLTRSLLVTLDGKPIRTAPAVRANAATTERKSKSEAAAEKPEQPMSKKDLAQFLHDLLKDDPVGWKGLELDQLELIEESYLRFGLAFNRETICWVKFLKERIGEEDAEIEAEMEAVLTTQREQATRECKKLKLEMEVKHQAAMSEQERQWVGVMFEMEKILERAMIRVTDLSNRLDEEVERREMVEERLDGYLRAASEEHELQYEGTRSLRDSSVEGSGGQGSTDPVATSEHVEVAEPWSDARESQQESGEREEQDDENTSLRSNAEILDLVEYWTDDSDQVHVEHVERVQVGSVDTESAEEDSSQETAPLLSW